MKVIQSVCIVKHFTPFQGVTILFCTILRVGVQWPIGISSDIFSIFRFMNFFFATWTWLDCLLVPLFPRLAWISVRIFCLSIFENFSFSVVGWPDQYLGLSFVFYFLKWNLNLIWAGGSFVHLSSSKTKFKHLNAINHRKRSIRNQSTTEKGNIEQIVRNEWRLIR